jgi:hypothetical protein
MTRFGDAARTSACALGRSLQQQVGQEHIAVGCWLSYRSTARLSFFPCTFQSSVSLFFISLATQHSLLVRRRHDDHDNHHHYHHHH